MSTTPKVSVIIPVYNVEKYLRQCLDSVVNQTLRDIEIICVDDGSTDSSLSLLQKYASGDNRIKILQQENSGAGIARNKGLAMASGKYILFLDSDDFFELDLCENLFYQAEKTEADIILYDADCYEQEKNKFVAVDWLLNRRYFPKKEVFNRNDVPDELFLITAGGPWNKLWKRQFLSEHELLFPNMKSLEDVPFVYTAMALAERISIVPKVLAHYRRFAPKQGLVSKIEKFPKRIFESYALLKSRLVKVKVFDIVEQSFINRAASDFVDQYLYIIKNPDIAQYFKWYLSRIASYQFNLRDKSKDYFLNKNVYNELQKLFVSDKNYEDVSGTPVVSIIVPVFNSEQFLHQCLNSILNQTFSDFELILVDDGSTDESVEILLQYQEIDKRIHVLQQNHQYAGVARNFGMSIAKGGYYLFLDSDDFFETTFVAEMYGSAQKFESDVVLCDGYYYNNETLELTPAKYLLQKYNIPNRMPFSCKDVPDKILHISIDCPWNKLFKAAFVKTKNLEFQALRSGNDQYFVDSALLLADRISVVDKKLVNYRTNVKTSLQATRAKEPLNFYQALCAIKQRIEPEKRYSLVKKGLYSLFITACRYHLNDAKSEEEFTLLYSFYQKTAFKEWDLSPYTDIFLSAADQKWVTDVCNLSEDEYFEHYHDKIIHIPQLEKNLPPIIVSLTSYPKRISTVCQTIQTILKQTFQADKIILWLASEQFPDGTKCLPEDLLKLQSEQFEIRWTEDIKSYKKLIPALSAFPDAIIITVDDDLLFESTLIEKLVNGYLKAPKYIQCHRITAIEYNGFDDIKIVPNASKIYHKPTYLHKLSGGAGCLYPPHCLHPDVMRKDLFMKLAPTSDDIWFWLMGVLNGVRVNVVENNISKLTYIPGTQDEALWRVNDHGEKLFFRHFKNILTYYPILKDVLSYEQMVMDSLLINNNELYDSGEIRDLEAKITALKRQNQWLQKEISLIHQSWTYRSGRFITWIPRMLRGFVQCYREHGFYYTFNRVLIHLRLKSEEVAVSRPTSPANAKENKNNNLVHIEKQKTPPVKRDYEYYFNLPPEKYPEELKIWFERITKTPLNLNNPQTYNEKIQWMKLYDSTPIKTKLADKYLVRDWVAEKIGKEYLIPLLGVWDSFDEIDFDKLPNQFVLKANHGSGWNIIVKDKATFNKESAKKKFDAWMQKNFAFCFGFELHYMGIQPKIIAEKYMEEIDQVYDYKFMCFDGEVKFIWVDTDRFTDHRRTLFTPKWERMNETIKCLPADYDIPKPKNFEQMLKCATILSQNFAHVRVDFYDVNGHIYFGEMTFTSGSGTEHANPREFELTMGNWIKLPPKSPIPERKVF